MLMEWLNAALKAVGRIASAAFEWACGLACGLAAKLVTMAKTVAQLIQHCLDRFRSLPCNDNDAPELSKIDINIHPGREAILAEFAVLEQQYDALLEMKKLVILNEG
jgi:hypothetical protein